MRAPGLASLAWTEPTGSADYETWVGADFRRTLAALQAEWSKANAEIARMDVPGDPYRSDALNQVNQGLREAVAQANAALQQSERDYRRFVAAVPKSIQISSRRPKVPAGRDMPVSISAEYTDGSRRNIDIASPLVAVEAPARLIQHQAGGAGVSSFGPTLRALAPGSGKLCVRLRSARFPIRSCIDVIVTAPELAELVVVPVSTAAASSRSATSRPVPVPAPVPPSANLMTLTLPLGSRMQLSARGRFTDESLQGLPVSAARALRWSAVPAEVATVDANGVVTCHVGGGQFANVKAHIADTPQWLRAERALIDPREMFVVPQGLSGSQQVICS